MLFYQEQVSRRLQEQSALHDSQAVRGMLNAVTDEFREYQLSCYLYAFSTFLDVVLQGALRRCNAQAASDKLQTYGQRYTQLYDRCRAQLEGYQKSAVDVCLLRDGLGNVAKTVGKALPTSPSCATARWTKLVPGRRQLKQLIKYDLSACLQRWNPCTTTAWRPLRRISPRSTISATMKTRSSPMERPLPPHRLITTRRAHPDAPFLFP